MALLSIFFQSWGSFLLMVGISVIYYFNDKTTRVPVKTLSSSHGLLIAILLGGALYFGRTGHPNQSYVYPYLFLFLLPISAILFSFFTFQGNKLIHLLQIPNLLCLLWAIFVGTMAVSGNWL